MISVLITLTTAGSDTGPFNLFSNVNGYTAAFETNVAKVDLIAGYTSLVVPNGTTIIRVMSEGVCKNYIDIVIGATTTTTSSSTTAAPFIIGRDVVIPVPIYPKPALIISYTDTNDFFVSKQVIPAEPSPIDYYLCIKCGTTVTVDDGDPNGKIIYDTRPFACNCS